MVITDVNQVVYHGDGSNTAWPFTFEITDASEIRVQLNNADGTAVMVNKDFYVDMITNTVYYPGYAPGAEPPENSQPPKVQAGQTITVYREIPLTQEVNLGSKWPFFVIEYALDKLTMIAQQIASGTTRTIDNALASMELLADVVVDSGELQHITDQLNNIDASATSAANSASYAAASVTQAETAVATAKSYANQAEGFANQADTVAEAMTDIYNDAIDQGTIIAPAVDRTLSVSGGAAEAAFTGGRIDIVKDAVDVGIKFWERGTYTATNTKNDTPAYRLRTPFYHFDNQIVELNIDATYSVLVFRRTSPTSTPNDEVTSGRSYYYCRSDYDYAFVLKPSGTTPMTLADSVHATIRVVQESTGKKDLGHGIYEIPIDIMLDTRFDDTDCTFKVNTSYACSGLIPLPKDGIRVNIREDYSSYTDVKPYFRAFFVKKTLSGLVLSDDDDLSAVNDATDIPCRSLYFPYVADTYMILSLYAHTPAGSETPVDISAYPDFLQVTSGHIEDTCGKPIGLMPAYTYFADGAFKISLTAEGGGVVQNYGFMVRLQDVDRIVCSPKYSLLATIFKVQSGTLTQYTEVISSGSLSTSDGLPCIDLTKYDFEGVAFIDVRNPIKVGSVESGGVDVHQIKPLTMGVMRAYTDVCNEVYVEYKNNVVIEYEHGLNSIIASNVQKFSEYTVPKIFATFYPSRKSPGYNVVEQTDVSLAWYAGDYRNNSVFLNIIDKSYITAAQNPNSRLYQFSSVDPPVADEDFNVHYGYGLTCTDFACAMLGLKENYSTAALAYGGNLKFDTYAWDYRYDMDKLKPGDILLHYFYDSDLGGFNRHVVVVYGKIYINGSIAGIDVVEGNFPISRHRMFYNGDYFRGINGLTSCHKFTSLAPWKYIARIKPQYIKRIDDTFSMGKSYTVGTVMCDRGTDSIYCLSIHKIMVSVSDDDATNLILKKDGVVVDTIDLTGAGTKNGLRIIDIKSYVTEPGYYTIETDADADVTQESFYVPANLSAPSFANNGNGTTTVTVPNYDELLYIELAYRRLYPGTGTYELIYQEYVLEQITDDGNGHGVITVPTSILTDTDDPATLYQSTCKINYLTDYGTYWLNGTGDEMSAEFSTDY